MAGMMGPPNFSPYICLSGSHMHLTLEDICTGSHMHITLAHLALEATPITLEDIPLTLVWKPYAPNTGHLPRSHAPNTCLEALPIYPTYLSTLPGNPSK